jgi:serine/threonine-protein kinase
MPDLIGESADAAAAVIAANGLELAPVARVETEEARPGLVIDQSPRPGTRLKRGTAVELAVAGEPTRAVPALAGTTPAAAERRLREMGLRIGQVVTEASPDARPGTIISQSPAADSRVPKNSGVDIVVAAPPPTRSVEAGPIWSQDDAKKKCPAVCAKANGGWTGHWWTTVEGKMSVCQCAF